MEKLLDGGSRNSEPGHRRWKEAGGGGRPAVTRAGQSYTRVQVWRFKSSIASFPEDGGADAYFGRAFLDGQIVIAAHTH